MRADIDRAKAELNAETINLNRLATFLPAADVQAVEWARRHLPKDGLIFCSYASGGLFAALAGRPVYVGHWSETPNAHQRTVEAIRFYEAAQAPSAERRAFLESRRIRYVYQGTIERYMGPTDLGQDPLFRPVYSRDGAAIYELRPATLVQGGEKARKPPMNADER